MTDAWDDDREELEEAEEEDMHLLGHDPVLGLSDEEADFHGDNLTRADVETDDDDDA